MALHIGSVLIFVFHVTHHSCDHKPILFIKYVPLCTEDQKEGHTVKFDYFAAEVDL